MEGKESAGGHTLTFSCFGPEIPLPSPCPFLPLPPAPAPSHSLREETESEEAVWEDCCGEGLWSWVFEDSGVGSPARQKGQPGESMQA